MSTKSMLEIYNIGSPNKNKYKEKIEGCIYSPYTNNKNPYSIKDYYIQKRINNIKKERGITKTDLEPYKLELSGVITKPEKTTDTYYDGAVFGTVYRWYNHLFRV